MKMKWKLAQKNSLRHCARCIGAYKSYPNNLCLDKNKSALNLFGYVAKVLNIYFVREPNEEDAIAQSFRRCASFFMGVV